AGPVLLAGAEERQARIGERRTQGAQAGVHVGDVPVGVREMRVEARAEVVRDAKKLPEIRAEREAERASAGGRRTAVQGAAPREGQAARWIEEDDGPVDGPEIVTDHGRLARDEERLRAVLEGERLPVVQVT